MAFGALEILALILIVIGIIKMVVILIISPKTWFKFAKKVYTKPTIVSIVALILGAVVLYYLVGAGVTIIHILAVMVFLALFATVGFAKFANEVYIHANRPYSLLLIHLKIFSTTNHLWQYDERWR